MKLHSAAAVLALALSTLSVTLVHASTVDDTTVSDTTVDANDVMPSVLDVAADLWTSMARAVSSAFSSTEKVTTLLPLESFQPHIVRLATSNWTVLNGWAMEDAGDGAHAATATATALLVHAPWCAHSRAALAQWRNLSRVVQQRSLAVRLCDVDAVADPGMSKWCHCLASADCGLSTVWTVQ